MVLGGCTLIATYRRRHGRVGIPLILLNLGVQLRGNRLIPAYSTFMVDARYFKNSWACIGPFRGKQLFCFCEPSKGPDPHRQPIIGIVHKAESVGTERHTPKGFPKQSSPCISTWKCHFAGIVTEYAFILFSAGSVTISLRVGSCGPSLLGTETNEPNQHHQNDRDPVREARHLDDPFRRDMNCVPCRT